MVAVALSFSKRMYFKRIDAVSLQHRDFTEEMIEERVRMTVGWNCGDNEALMITRCSLKIFIKLRVGKTTAQSFIGGS
ncbi:hypothetical protein Tco_0945393 [Tanacetum coccineum]